MRREFLSLRRMLKKTFGRFFRLPFVLFAFFSFPFQVVTFGPTELRRNTLYVQVLNKTISQNVNLRII